MKALTISLLIALFIISQSCGVALKNVPTKVKTAFSKSYPDAKCVVWEKDNETEWEVAYKIAGKEYSSVISNEGAWKQTEQEIKESDIPAQVKQTIDREFMGYEVDEIEKVETANGEFYEFELEKGKTEIEVIIDKNGKVINKKKDDEDEGNEKDD